MRPTRKAPWFTCRAIGGLALLTIAVGCVSMDTPQGFVELDAPSSEFKAVTADDALVWVRRFEDPTAGEPEFWAATLRTELVENRGYTLISERSAAVGDWSGAEFLCEANTLGEPRRYLILALTALDWGGTEFVVLEYTAAKKIFDTHLENVRKAATTLRTTW